MIVIAPPTRQTNIVGLLGDIEARLWSGHPYRDDDKVTWGHEGTHGVNSVIRNQYNGYRGQDCYHHYKLDAGTGMTNNAAYMLGDQAVVVKEPNFKLNDIATEVPQELRGNVYQLYLIDQQRYWNDHPLYVFDELSAYWNGTRVGMEVDVEYNRLLYSFERLVEFLGYARILIDVNCRTNQIIIDEELETLPVAVNEFILENINDFPDARDQYETVKKYVYLFGPPILQWKRPSN